MQCKLIIATRYSSDMQRAESCDDQERKVRQELDKLGIDHRNAIVLRDKGISGTKETREGYAKIEEMIRHGVAFILAVDDQSRLSRNLNVGSLIQDLVFNGGRFISAEGIDTDRDGWELLVGIHGMTNNAYLKDLGRRVRRGQEGRVLDGNGSAGDLAFGYGSHFVDPQAATNRSRRGPKPKKDVIIKEDEAAWVRQVFKWHAEGNSIEWIARDLTRKKVPKGAKGSVEKWHHHAVRRMLSNTKYIGRWVWGCTETVTASAGKKKQAPVPEKDHTVTDHPTCVSLATRFGARFRLVSRNPWRSTAIRMDRSRAG